MIIKRLLILLFFMVSGITACNFYLNHQFRSTYQDTNALLHEDPIKKAFLKAHLKNGNVILFDSLWNLNTDQTKIIGNATTYDFNRNLLEAKVTELPVSDVALFETNRPILGRDKAQIAAMSILTGVDVILGIICLTNPKACFGSCPTFYYQRDDYLNYANAEGFSSSISPTLETSDLDALNNPETRGPEFTLTMKNEALENHAVNQVKLLAVARQQNRRVFANQADRFYSCSQITPITLAQINGENITKKVQHLDGQEYFSSTDSLNLSKKEIIHLTFNNENKNKDVGIVLNFRQTLLTTFLLYSALGYMGDEAGDMFAKIETDTAARRQLFNGYNMLGGIEVLVYNPKNKKWQQVETLYETGPIAKNLQFVNLPSFCRNKKKVKVQLRMAKGSWRLDYTALAAIEQQVQPVVPTLYAVTKNNQPDSIALKNLLIDDARYEASLPGDNYKLIYRLPDSRQDYELFVQSKGYYLEWMRQNWLKNKDLLKLKRMLQNDPDTWASLAKEFKGIEQEMESTFWGSKVVQ